MGEPARDDDGIDVADGRVTVPEQAALAAEGATGIVVVSLSGALSATMQSAELAARSVTDVVPVRVVDSRSVTSPSRTRSVGSSRNS